MNWYKLFFIFIFFTYLCYILNQLKHLKSCKQIYFVNQNVFVQTTKFTLKLAVSQLSIPQSDHDILPLLTKESQMQMAF